MQSLSLMKTFNQIIEHEKTKPYFKEIESFIENEYQSKTIFPPRDCIYAALEYCEYEDVKVVILGQDPYHGIYQANGLAFSVNKAVSLPPSLKNIFKEMVDDLGVEMPYHGDLQSWAKQGVLLLNTTLTVEQGKANSHSKCGWQIFTQQIIEELNNREKPMVFILWGSQAIEKGKNIDKTKHCVIESVHPSPLSSYRGFFGSKPFSKANQFLKENNIEEIDWSIDELF